MHGHTCSMTPVVILSKNAGSNEPQSHADFSHSVGLKRVVESEGGVRMMERQRRACGWLEWLLLWLTGAPWAIRRLKASGVGDDEGSATLRPSARSMWSCAKSKSATTESLHVLRTNLRYPAKATPVPDWFSGFRSRLTLLLHFASPDPLLLANKIVYFT